MHKLSCANAKAYRAHNFELKYLSSATKFQKSDEIKNFDKEFLFPIH